MRQFVITWAGKDKITRYLNSEDGWLVWKVQEFNLFGEDMLPEISRFMTRKNIKGWEAIEFLGEI